MSDHWQRVEALFHEALGRQAADRHRFVASATTDDDRVRSDVESLLQHADEDEGFLDPTRLDLAAVGAFAGRPPAFAPGARIASYEILAAMGSGGAADVYRARDGKLGRDVALKIMSDASASSWPLRFDREVQALASLSHPNIAQIHDAGRLDEPQPVMFLAMELVEGRTLADVLHDRGPLPLREALVAARQIAQALEAAHAAGIVHRDLKPANVKLRDDGVVKILDFGLAKMIGARAAGDVVAPRASSPTNGPHVPASIDLTAHGVVLGTAGYMAPEQVDGNPVDRRVDVWAFGAVLFEMLTGRRAFPGSSTAEVLDAIRHREPALADLAPNVPSDVRRLLRRCLEKDRLKRLTDLGAARLELDEAIEALARPALGARTAWSVASTIGAAAVTGLAVYAGAAAWRDASSVSPSPIARYVVGLPEHSSFTRPGRHVIAVSPDGERLAYVVDRQLVVRPLGSLDATPVPGVVDPLEVFFSPDSRSLGFYADGRFHRVEPSGGAPIALGAAQPPFGASWQDHTILFGQDDGIYRLPAAGGTAERIVLREGAARLASPQLMPDGDAVLFTMAEPMASGDGFDWTDAEIVYENLRTRERRVIVRGGSDGKYISTGHLVYARGRTVVAAPFNLATLEVGTPVPLADGVGDGLGGLTGAAQFGVSAAGTFAFVPGAPVETELLWMDFRGRETPVTRVRGWYGNPRFSPDGSRLAITDGPASGDVAVLDLSRGAKMRVTTHHASDIAPIWSPDGTRLAFRSDRDGGVYNIHWQRADGSGRAERLAASRTVQAPADWTRDGRTLIYTDLRPGTGLDIMSLTFTDPQLVRPLVATKFTQTEPALSPDGRWLAYQSDELGHFEVELRPYPDVDRMRLQVSTDGGTRPVWSPDSRAVFFVHGGAIYRAAVSDGQPFRVGRPERVLQNLPTEALGFFYTVAPDGNRFVIVRPVSGSGLAAEYRVLSDWRAVADNR